MKIELKTKKKKRRIARPRKKQTDATAYSDGGKNNQNKCKETWIKSEKEKYKKKYTDNGQFIEKQQQPILPFRS